VCGAHRPQTTARVAVNAELHQRLHAKLDARIAGCCLVKGPGDEFLSLGVGIAKALHEDEPGESEASTTWSLTLQVVKLVSSLRCPPTGFLYAQCGCRLKSDTKL
jgi:hypothetical protein